MSEEILKALVRQYPNARLTTANQPLSEADFKAQKHKHFSRQALGGAIGIIRDPDGRIVLAKRSGMHAGWSLPGGTVEEGEDFAVAFHREISEEIGVSLDGVDLIELERKTFISPQGERFDFLLAVFEARMREERLPAPTDDAIAEGLEITLCDPSDIPSEMILSDRQKLAQYLNATQSQGLWR
jgi:ADP-ribose pyrophosphatase YjhB (NUDIX family)